MTLTLSDNLCPDFGYVKTVEPRIRVSDFGDGYKQVIKDGINTILGNFTQNWTNLPQVDADALEAFFESHGGVTPFFWLPPDETTVRLYRAVKWSRSPTNFGVYKFTSDWVEEVLA